MESIKRKGMYDKCRYEQIRNDACELLLDREIGVAYLVIPFVPTLEKTEVIELKTKHNEIMEVYTVISKLSINDMKRELQKMINIIEKGEC